MSVRSAKKGSVPRIGVLISGRGSNVEALVRAAHEGRLDARIAVVISSVAGAGGLAVARDAGIESLVMPHRAHGSRESYDQSLVQALRARDVGLVCLAGFTRLLGPTFCQAFPLAVLNIHPSLLPAFPGMGAQQQAIDHGVKVTGATVHFVTPELDAGPIVAQRSVPVLETDTREALSARVLAAEHDLYADAVQRVLWERWNIVGRRVVFDDASDGC